jgi:hypothetical protein
VRLKLPFPLAAVAVPVACAAALAYAPAALAATATAGSSNWAGYAVHRAGVSYRIVQGSWRQPSVACTRGVQTYSSYWVGLGGYSEAARALEQIGTEVDCSRTGRMLTSAWYELVPGPSKPIRLRVHSGDVMTASVTVNRKRVSLSLYDVTRTHGFTKTLTASSIDVSSAEWIVEAPSSCAGDNACQTLPLANFGTVEFSPALAMSTSGQAGGISDSVWRSTKIKLVPDARRFALASAVTAVGGATPSALAANGSSFKVSYTPVSVSNGSQAFARQSSSLRAGSLAHPAR